MQSQSFRISVHEEEEDDRNRRLPANTRTCAKGKLANSSFNGAIRRLTAFATSEMTHALLNDTDTALVARCSTNWYVVTNGGIPSVTCDEFREQDCDNNQDLEFTDGDNICLEPSSAPTSMPSEMPSSMPSAPPSSVPSASTMPSSGTAPSVSVLPSLAPSAILLSSPEASLDTTQ